MTQMELARAGQVTPAMQRVAEKEGLDPEYIRQGVAEGVICIPRNIYHNNIDPSGFGKGLKTKVNANIGTSTEFPSVERELEKMWVAIRAGADAVMDLSTGSAAEIDRCRKAIMSTATVPVGTVPIYQAAVEATERRGAIVNMTVDDLFEVIERQAQDGVDFMTVHVGATLETINRLKQEGRVTDIVSRGGAFITGWMLHQERENPLYEHFDRLLELARKYDITLSLGDALRPGSIADATDRAQIQELLILGELVGRAWEAGVQVMVEGPGHVPLDQVEMNIKLQKELCHGAPFYVLGPLVTDVAPGYDHITSAIGGAVAGAAGADFLCYVTPSEHLGLPDLNDVREGVIAAKIAGHAADIVKGVKGAREWDKAMSTARKALDWDTQLRLAIDPDKARRVRADKNPREISECTMCGPYCAMKVVGEFLGVKMEAC